VSQLLETLEAAEVAGAVRRDLAPADAITWLAEDREDRSPGKVAARSAVDHLEAAEPQAVSRGLGSPEQRSGSKNRLRLDEAACGGGSSESRGSRGTAPASPSTPPSAISSAMQPEDPRTPPRKHSPPAGSGGKRSVPPLPPERPAQAAQRPAPAAAWLPAGPAAPKGGSCSSSVSPPRTRERGPSKRASDPLPRLQSSGQKSRGKDRLCDARLWAAVRACLARPHEHDEAHYALCRELASTRAECDTAEERLQEAERRSALSVVEDKRREREIRRLRSEIRHQAARLDEAHAAVEVLAKRAAEAQTAKNRAQREAWQLRHELQDGAFELAAAQAKEGRPVRTATRVGSRGLCSAAAGRSAGGARESKSTRSLQVKSRGETSLSSADEVPCKPPKVPQAAAEPMSADESTACSSPRSSSVTFPPAAAPIPRGPRGAGSDAGTPHGARPGSAQPDSPEPMQLPPGDGRWAWPGDVVPARLPDTSG